MSKMELIEHIYFSVKIHVFRVRICYVKKWYVKKWYVKNGILKKQAKENNKF